MLEKWNQMQVFVNTRKIFPEKSLVWEIKFASLAEELLNKKQQHLRLKQYKIVWILTSCPLLTVEMNSCELFAHSFHMAHMSLGESYSCHLNKYIFVMLGEASDFILLEWRDPGSAVGNWGHLVQLRTL